MKKILAMITLLLFGTVYFAVAESGRESKQLPPQEVEIMYSSEDHAYQAKDINDVVRWRVLPDGTMAIRNRAGHTVWGIRGDTGSGVSGIPTAILSGTTGTIAWSAGSPGGASGWHLTETYLNKYKTFQVEMSWPYTVKADGGATVYSDKCPVGAANTGATIYVPDVTASLHGHAFEFINTEGTTPFVIYHSGGRFRFGAATGTTTFSGLTGVLGGTTSIPDGIGDSITVKAIFTPTPVSGWYVVGKSILEE